jgi:hypothetical protein
MTSHVNLGLLFHFVSIFSNDSSGSTENLLIIKFTHILYCYNCFLFLDDGRFNVADFS